PVIRPLIRHAARSSRVQRSQSRYTARFESGLAANRCLRQDLRAVSIEYQGHKGDVARRSAAFLAGPDRRQKPRQPRWMAGCETIRPQRMRRNAFDHGVLQPGGSSVLLCPRRCIYGLRPALLFFLDRYHPEPSLSLDRNHSGEAESRFSGKRQKLRGGLRYRGTLDNLPGAPGGCGDLLENLSERAQHRNRAEGRGGGLARQFHRQPDRVVFPVSREVSQRTSRVFHQARRFSSWRDRGASRKNQRRAGWLR